MLDLAARIEAQGNPYKDAPTTAPVGRLDEVKAARDLDCAYLEALHEAVPAQA